MKKNKKIVLVIILLLIVTGCKLRLNEKEKSSDISNSENQDNTIINNNPSSDTSNNTRNFGFIELAKSFVDAVKFKVNEGRDFHIYDTSTLFFIPVGNINNSCVTLEKDTKSPFSDTWNYAFVGVSYNGYEYNYYFIGEDGSNIGIELIDYNDLMTYGSSRIYKSYNATKISKDISNKLIEIYNINENKSYNNISGDSTNKWMNDILLNYEDKDNIIFISKSAGCKYQ